MTLALPNTSGRGDEKQDKAREQAGELAGQKVGVDMVLSLFLRSNTMSNDDVSDQFTRGWISLGIGLLMLLVGLLDLLRFTAKGSMGAGFEAAFFLILGLFLLVRGAKLRPKS